MNKIIGTFVISVNRFLCAILLIGLFGMNAVSSASAETLQGRVLGAGAPIANSTVTLWAAGTDAPVKVDEAKTDDNGTFKLDTG
ncbi:MAG: hypothetical protein KJ002_06795, partial [Candidatus Dadabacteria bacterium]|nr:hypothetical protein [Candidatus Dadabacteria bacterium]